jgi:adenylylsulfate kinase
MITNNIFKSQSKVNLSERNKNFKHRSFVIWFTGLSGSGKSTLSQALEKNLFDEGYHPYMIDGDNLRHGLCSDLSFDIKDRHENIRRVAEISKLMIDAGLIIITSFISPFEKDRALAKKLIGDQNFIEVYCNSSLDVCEKRDVKGLYKKARLGLIQNFTGIDSPYEKPPNPDLSIDTSLTNIEDSVFIIVEFLKKFHYIK